jgi:hypothetical protein
MIREWIFHREFREIWEARLILAFSLISLISL